MNKEAVGKKVNPVQGAKGIEDAKRDILEETADVIIMLTQLIMIYGGRDTVQENIDIKVNRQKRRLTDAQKTASEEAAQEVLQPAT